MELSVFWTNFAKDNLNDIYEYYKTKANVLVARRVINEIIDHTTLLEAQPLIGQREEFLNERPQGFRYLVHNNYKIIYWIKKQKNRIDVSHVFDCRQDPLKISRLH